MTGNANSPQRAGRSPPPPPTNGNYLALASAIDRDRDAQLKLTGEIATLNALMSERNQTFQQVLNDNQLRESKMWRVVYLLLAVNASLVGVNVVEILQSVMG